MANLNKLYQASGLSGVLPYAVGASGKRFLHEKLLGEGVYVWLIMERKTGMPFVFAEDDKVYFRLFSTREAANRTVEELTDAGFTAQTAELTPDAVDFRALWTRYRELGANYISFDDTVWVALRELSKKPEYDGFHGAGRPLKNAQLNAALYCATQWMAAGIENTALTAYFWEIFQRSRLYVPRRDEDTEEVALHFAELEDGRQAFLAFTDDVFLSNYAACYELSKDISVYIPDYKALREYMAEHPETPVILNHCAGDFLLDNAKMNELDQIVLTEGAFA